MLHKQYTATQMLLALREGVIQPTAMQREYCQNAIELHRRALADAERDGHHDQAEATRKEVAVWTARLEATR